LSLDNINLTTKYVTRGKGGSRLAERFQDSNEHVVRDRTRLPWKHPPRNYTEWPLKRRLMANTL